MSSFLPAECFGVGTAAARGLRGGTGRRADYRSGLVTAASGTRGCGRHMCWHRVRAPQMWSETCGSSLEFILPGPS